MLTRLVRSAGHSVEYRSTEEPGWDGALAPDADLVAVAGGDGTVGDVLRGLRDGRRRWLLTVLPLGSANNIAHSLGLTGRDLADLVAGWPGAARRPYRLGDVTSDGGGATFVEAVGGGLFAESVRQTPDEPDGDKVLLGLRTLRRLLDELPAEPWEAELDGRPRECRCIAVEAMAIGWTGPGVPLAPAADPGDEVLDVVMVEDGDRAELGAYVDERLRGRFPRPPELPRTRCQSAVLAAPPGSALRIDDELWEPSRTTDGRARLVVTAAAAVVEMLLP